MKLRTAISIILVSTLALASTASYAQRGGGGGGSGGGAMDRTHQVDRDRTYDRDRMQDRDRSGDRAGDRQQDRARDRIHAPDQANMKDGEIYGNALMSDAERKQYRNQIGNAESQQAREQYQQQHEQKMQERALRQGQDLVPPGQGPVFGGEFMSVQERNQYREQLRMLDSDQDRQQFQKQHRERMHQRAEALGLDVGNAD